jgi:hypothetical protein
MIAILCLIILSLVSVILFLIIKILKQKKLIFCYDKSLKDKGKIQQLFSLVTLAKLYGHNIEIEYSTLYDYCYVGLYKKNWANYWDIVYEKKITNDEEFGKAIKELERLIK